MAKITRENLNYKAYKAIKKMINNYYFKPGERINVEKVARELQISRTPVWEAIRRLEQEGLFLNLPNKQGVYMHALTQQEAIDLIEVRQKLEEMVAILAAKNIDDKTILKLEKILDKQKNILLNQDIIAYAQSDTEFHTLIYESTTNKYLVEILKNIQSKIHPISMHFSDFMHNFYINHIEIIDSLKSRDSYKIQAKLREHTQYILKVIRNGEMTFISSDNNK